MSDAERIAYCKTCSKDHDGKPPCDDCEWKPEKLLPENLDALELWLAVQTQWRASGFGIIGLDYSVLQREADRLEIELSICTMNKVKALEAYTLRKIHRNAEGDDKRDKPDPKGD